MSGTRQAVKVSVALPAVVYVTEVRSSWQREGEPERVETTYRFHCEVPHATGALGIESVGGFPSVAKAMREGRKALRAWAEKLDSQVSADAY